MSMTIRFWNGKPRKNSSHVFKGKKYDIVYWNGLKLEFFAYSRFNKECGIKEYPQEVLDDLIAGKKIAYIKKEGDRRTAVFEDVTENQGENQQQEAAANQEVAL